MPPSSAHVLIVSKQLGIDYHRQSLFDILLPTHEKYRLYSQPRPIISTVPTGLRGLHRGGSAGHCIAHRSDGLSIGEYWAIWTYGSDASLFPT
jgi:hypothetical protein